MGDYESVPYSHRMIDDLDGPETQAVVSLVLKHKDFTVRPTVNAAGHYIVGYGRDLNEHPLNVDEQAGILFRLGLPEEVGRQWVREDVFALHRSLVKQSWYRKLDPARQAAIASMAYDLSIFGLKHYRTAWRLMDDGHYGKACDYLASTQWICDQGRRGEELLSILRHGFINP